MIKIIKAILFRVRALLKRDPDRFLKKATGVIHVGANTGQEIQLYAKYGLPVIWIEPIPEVFETLKTNLIGIPKQLAIQGLVTDMDNTEYQFHIANNYGASSSILELNLHQDIWPQIKYEKTIKLQSNTLASLLKNNHINIAEYDTLIMDTQGSELLVLKGSVPILQNFTYIKTEVSDFESYKGCCQLKDIESFLINRGYIEFFRHKFIEHPDGGSYYDIVYKKRSDK
jgi:FkbM family methyltransferase